MYMQRVLNIIKIDVDVLQIKAACTYKFNYMYKHWLWSFPCLTVQCIKRSRFQKVTSWCTMYLFVHV